MLHVPYKGSADLSQAILGGHVMSAADSTGFAPLVDSGKLRVLNTWGEQRLPKSRGPCWLPATSLGSLRLLRSL